MASSTSNPPRKRLAFAPLGQSPRTADEMQLQGIVFDMDGTLCLPQNHMFLEMRTACAIPQGEDILDYIHSLPPREQESAFEKIQAIERKAMREQVPQAGLAQLMDFLDRHAIRKGICTRNFDAPVHHLLTTYIPSHLRHPFSPIITRDFRPPKPSPAGILHIARSWGLVSSAEEPPASSPPSERPLPLIMVGDSVDDMAAGRDAGALTVLLRSEGKEELEGDERTDVVVGRLDELIGLLEEGLTSRS